MRRRTPEIDGWLKRLAGAEILEERRESRFPGEREVRFRHALMRDAAYGLLTADDAVVGHRAAAGYLEARGEPDALVLAEHFEKGRDGAARDRLLRQGRGAVVRGERPGRDALVRGARARLRRAGRGARRPP